MQDQKQQPTQQELLDQLRAHPDTGLVIFFDFDEMRDHVANARGVEPEDISDEDARTLARHIEWNLDFDYESIATDE